MDNSDFQPRPPKGFLFDMDGLLLDTERLGLKLFLQICGGLDIAADAAEAQFLDLIGGSRSVNSAKIERFLKGRLDPDGFERAWIDGKDQMLQDNVPLRPYVREVISGLAAQGAKMAVVTSTIGSVARSELEKADLLRHFQCVIAGDEVTANKPDPAPYLQGAAALGFDPSECAAFEDSDTGITAAMRAGCQAVQIPDLRAPDVALPDLGQKIAADLRQAVALFGFQVQTETV
ncbi:HAD superfamily hydrolase (TIGR01509 family) [Pacificibacter maritimus]|uniref:HAD superfamily hydrolase (TIGR01509 family) n=1 Tax=Pacificibacter maritimus TaxID=762213 RepID=A0A3N4UUR8_9RHOB|nr:HAD family phosphatase [Pacificibacter maritimus]RPE71331.1 HAD superfamily hydrolase (TIGR01509 family) [Pacificibacter maritimus]